MIRTGSFVPSAQGKEEITLNGDVTMKNVSIAAACCFALLTSGTALARDDKSMQSIEKAMSQPAAAEKLGSDVKFFFGNSAHPPVEKSIGTFPTSKKTNGVGKSDEEACNWAFLSAMISLRDRAVREGANAVINIQSNYKNVPVSSETEFECHSGGIMSGVALKGEVVKLK